MRSFGRIVEPWLNDRSKLLALKGLFVDRAGNSSCTRLPVPKIRPRRRVCQSVRAAHNILLLPEDADMKRFCACLFLLGLGACSTLDLSNTAAQAERSQCRAEAGRYPGALEDFEGIGPAAD